MVQAANSRFAAATALADVSTWAVTSAWEGRAARICCDTRKWRPRGEGRATPSPPGPPVPSPRAPAPPRDPTPLIAGRRFLVEPTEGCPYRDRQAVRVRRVRAGVG